MKRGQIFNKEKILYFANNKGSFHVQSDEPRDSDCRIMTDQLEAGGLLKKLEIGGSGEFYGITKAGRIRLLELQIQWRKRNNKSVDALLSALEQEQAK